MSINNFHKDPVYNTFNAKFIYNINNLLGLLGFTTPNHKIVHPCNYRSHLKLDDLTQIIYLNKNIDPCTFSVFNSIFDSFKKNTPS